MIPLTLTDIALATGGTVINQPLPDITVSCVSTDSRVIGEHCLFIALQGENFDAHQFVEQVVSAGASCLLVNRSVDTRLPHIIVEDTRIALGMLAALVKQRIHGLKCAAITGSNGKTTTKELLSHIIAQMCDNEEQVLATAGNFNNDIGLPLTLLRLTGQCRFAVVELGANHAGEIAYTANIAKPDVALVNNVMPAHLEGFGSLEGVAKAKGEMWANIQPGGTAVVNLDSDFAGQYLQQLKCLPVNILTFSAHNSDANVYASALHFDEQGKALFTLNASIKGYHQTAHINLNLPGKHNVSNALAASAMAMALGCEIALIERGLGSVNPVAGRVNSMQINEKMTLIDDTYNANSASVKAAIDLLSQHSGEHLLILGDMAELGAQGENEHKSIGLYAAQHKIEHLYTVGELTKYSALAFTENSQYKGVHFNNKQQLSEYLQQELPKNNAKLTLLVKGSRGAKMEEIVSHIKQLNLSSRKVSNRIGNLQ